MSESPCPWCARPHEGTCRQREAWFDGQDADLLAKDVEPFDPKCQRCRTRTLTEIDRQVCDGHPACGEQATGMRVAAQIVKDGGRYVASHDPRNPKEGS